MSSERPVSRSRHGPRTCGTSRSGGAPSNRPCRPRYRSREVLVLRTWRVLPLSRRQTLPRFRRYPWSSRDAKDSLVSAEQPHDSLSFRESRANPRAGRDVQRATRERRVVPRSAPRGGRALRSPRLRPCRGLRRPHGEPLSPHAGPARPLRPRGSGKARESLGNKAETIGHRRASRRRLPLEVPGCLPARFRRGPAG